MRTLCSILCTALLVVPPPAASAQNTAPKKPTIKEQVVLTPAGSLVEVKTHDKRKLRGRMGAVTDTGFTVQHVEKDTLQDSKIEFADVKSFKQREQGMSTGAKVALGVLAGVGGTILALYVIIAVALN